MIYNSLTVNYTSSMAFNSLLFLSVAHLFYKTPRFLYLGGFRYYFPLTQVTFKLKCIILLEKFWMCLSEDRGGWQICGDTRFIEKYLSGNMKNALWRCKLFQWETSGSEENCYLSPKRSPRETRSWCILLWHVEDPGSRLSRNLNLGSLDSGEHPGNGVRVDHASVGFKKSWNILFLIPGQDENSLGTCEIFQDG